MSNRKRKNKGRTAPDEYLNDLKIWQDHQYIPGYVRGGSISSQNRKIAGIILILLSILLMAIKVFFIILGRKNYIFKDITFFAYFIILTIFGLLLMKWGTTNRGK